MGIVVPEALRKGLLLGVALAAAAGAVAVASALASPADSATATASRDRAVTDMTDDISGPQVHFLYIVPSDGADRQLDTNGDMEQSIARIERWFVTHAERQGLRIDTYNEVPDITFVRLPHSGAQATATNPWPLWVIGEDLVAAGFNDQAKVYAATASFRSSAHGRTLTLRVRAQRATGSLGVVDGFTQCRSRVPVLVERRGKQGWSSIRSARTDSAGRFTASIPSGRATYRARAPETTANGERCVATVSRVATSTGG